MYKIAFFDIDGTLFDHGQTMLSDKVKEALTKLREKGIQTWVSTGRPPYVVPSYFIEQYFDGIICLNGQYCFNREGIVYHAPIDKKDVMTVIENAKKMGHPMQVCGRDRMLANGTEKWLEDYFDLAHQKVNVSDEFDEFIKGDIYEMMIALKMGEEKELLENTTTVRSSCCWHHAIDIIPIDGGKKKGVNEVLKYYGYSKEEALAFGDSQNDIDMFEAVGFKIAMGNGTKEIKELADYITDSVLEDGIYTACINLKLIEE